MGFVKEDTIDNFRAPGIEFLGETLSDQPSVSVGMGGVFEGQHVGGKSDVNWIERDYRRIRDAAGEFVAGISVMPCTSVAFNSRPASAPMAG